MRLSASKFPPLVGTSSLRLMMRTLFYLTALIPSSNRQIVSKGCYNFSFKSKSWKLTQFLVRLSSYCLCTLLTVSMNFFGFSLIKLAAK